MYRNYIKRILDIVLSAGTIAVLLPVYLIISILVIIFMGFPVLFKQERIGKNEKPFMLYKFRTMTNAMDFQGKLLSEEKRVTKFGAFLRSSSLDELPELFSILKGDMSFVGPRPLPSYYMPYYFPKEKVRHMVRGGLIPPDGLSGKPVVTWEEQFCYEVDYAKHVSFLLDIKIVYATFTIVVKRIKENYGAEFRPHLNDYRKEAETKKNEEISKYRGSKVNRSLLLKVYEKYNSPLYIFSSQDFISNYRRLESAFQNIYPKYKIAYSYKTNYTPRVCCLVKQLGGYAEVVSDMEYELAKKIGYENSRIIFNGPYKGEKLEEHLLDGGIVNADHLQEVKRLINLCRKYPGQEFQIGIRVNIDVEQNFISRFGIDAASDDLEEAFRLVRESKNVTIVGLHCHISRARNLAAWKKRTETMLSLADKYFEIPPKYIDLGSGMYGDMEEDLAKQFGNDVPTYEDYAAVVGILFKEHYGELSEADMPVLFTEPGTTLISRYVGLLCEVTSIKRIKNKWFAILNCSNENLGEISTMKKLPMQILNRGGNLMKNAGVSETVSDLFQTNFYKSVDLVGYTCLEQDVIYPEYNGQLSVGDVIYFGNVGGYSVVSKPPFILPNCPMIEIDGENMAGIIKRQETFDDLFQTFTF